MALTLSNAAPVNTRAMLDATYVVVTNIPGAGNQANSNAMDLIQATPYPTTEYVQLQVLSAGGNGANNKNCNYTLQDSADNVTFANVALVGNPLLRVTDQNGSNYNTVSASILLPPSIRRYVRAQANAEANSGTGAGGTFTLQLAF